jgi:hypothetical protein
MIAISTAGTGRFRIDASGQIGLSVNPVAGRSLSIARSIIGSVDAYGVLQTGVVQSGVTAACRGYGNVLSTQSAFFTLPFYAHYSAQQGTIGANSVVSQQIGFYVDNTLVGATLNFGFRSVIGAGSGRWNVYADGTAANWFAGNVGIGASRGTPATALDVNGTVTTTGLDVSADGIRVRTARTPASATAAGDAGTVCWDSDYVYVCVQNNVWKRAALASW